jgi:hypothetical protein
VCRAEAAGSNIAVRPRALPTCSTGSSSTYAPCVLVVWHPACAPSVLHGGASIWCFAPARTRPVRNQVPLTSLVFCSVPSLCRHPW